MTPLTQVCTYTDNTTSQGSETIGSIRSVSSIGPSLRKFVLVTRRHHLHASLRRVSSKNKVMEDAASCLKNIYNFLFLKHYYLHPPKTTPWRLLRLTSNFRHHLTTMILNKHSLKKCTIKSARKIPVTGRNGAGSLAGFTAPHTSEASRTSSGYSRFLLSASAPAFYPQELTPNRRNW